MPEEVHGPYRMARRLTKPFLAGFIRLRLPTVASVTGTHFGLQVVRLLRHHPLHHPLHLWWLRLFHFHLLF